MSLVCLVDVRIRDVRWHTVRANVGTRSPNKNTCKVTLSLVSKEKKKKSTHRDRIVTTGALCCNLPAVSPCIVYRVELASCVHHGVCSDTNEEQSATQKKSDKQRQTQCTCAFVRLVSVLRVDTPSFAWLQKKLGKVYRKDKGEAARKLLKRIHIRYKRATKSALQQSRKRKRKRSLSSASAPLKRDAQGRACTFAERRAPKAQKANNSERVKKQPKRSTHKHTSVHESSSSDSMMTRTTTTPLKEDVFCRKQWWRTHDWSAYRCFPLARLLDGIAYSKEALYFLRGVCRCDRAALVGVPSAVSFTHDRHTPAALPCIDIWNPPGWSFVLLEFNEKESGRKEETKARTNSLKDTFGMWRWCASGPIMNKRSSSETTRTRTLIASGELREDKEAGIALWKQWAPQYDIVRALWDTHGERTECFVGSSRTRLESLLVQPASTRVAVYCQSYVRARFLQAILPDITVFVVTLTGVQECLTAAVALSHRSSGNNSVIRTENKNGDRKDIMMDTSTNTSLGTGKEGVFPDAFTVELHCATYVFFDHVQDWTLLHGYLALKHCTGNVGSLVRLVAHCAPPPQEPERARYTAWQNDASPRLFWACVSRFLGSSSSLYNTTVAGKQSNARTTRLLESIRTMANETPMRQRHCSVPRRVGAGFSLYAFPASGLRGAFWRNIRSIGVRMRMRAVLFVCASSANCTLLDTALSSAGTSAGTNANWKKRDVTKGDLVYDLKCDLFSVVVEVDTTSSRDKRFNACLCLQTSRDDFYHVRKRSAHLQRCNTLTAQRLLTQQFSYDSVLVVVVLSDLKEPNRAQFTRTQLRRVLARCGAIKEDHIVIVGSQAALQSISTGKTTK